MEVFLPTINQCGNATHILNFSDPDVAGQVLYHISDKMIVSVLIPILSMFGFIGNASILYIFYLLPDARVPVGMYMATLAMCDLCYLLSVNIWNAVVFGFLQIPVHFASPVNSSLGCALCKISVDLWYYTSLGTVTLITVERYFATCYPIKHRSINSTGRTRKILTGIWVGALIVTLTEVPKHGKLTTNCLLWPNEKEFENLPVTVRTCDPTSITASIYGSSSVIVTFVVLLTINLILFVKTLQGLRKNLMNNPSSDRIHSQVTRTLIVNGLVFFICQFPYRVRIMDDILDLTEDVVFITPGMESLSIMIARAFLVLNSTVNPYIYCGCSFYRWTMIQVFFKRCCSRKNVPEVTEISRSRFSSQSQVVTESVS